ncbi:MAG: TonB-dependent receptor [Bacteroidota bacterium]
MLRRLVLLFLVCSLAPLRAQDAPSDEEEPLDELSELLGEEVETAEAYIQQAREAAASVTVVTSEEIARADYRTLADVLNNVRGFFLTDDRRYAYAGVRGIGRPSGTNNRIAVFVDGVPLRNGFNDAAPISLVLGVPLTAVDRIEVLRGPGSARYGTGAMFAVVNVILKDTRTLDGARASASVGVYGSYHGEAVVSTDLPGGVGIALAVHGRREDNPDVVFSVSDFYAGRPTAGVPSADWSETYGVLAAVQRGPFRLDLRYGERTRSMPSGAFATAFGLDSEVRDRSATATLRAEHALSPRVTLSGTGALDHYSTASDLDVIVEPGVSEPLEALYLTDATVARAGTQMQWDANSAYRLTAGAEVLSQFQSEGRAFAEASTFFPAVEYYDARDPFTAGAVWAEGEVTVAPTLLATAGTRFDAVRGKTALSPRGALVFTPDRRTSLKLVAGSAFRAPSSYELSIFLEELGQAQAIDLGAERVVSVEAIAAREVVPGLRLEGSLFTTYARDFIDLAYDPEDDVNRFANVERARSQGAEIEAEALVARWRARASYGYQRTSNPDTDADEQLSNSPAHVGKLTAFGPLGRGFWLSVGGRAESRRTTWNPDTDAFAVLDAALSADVLGDLGRLTLGVRNAFDADYVLPARPEHDQATIPQRPRTVYLRLDVRL